MTRLVVSVPRPTLARDLAPLPDDVDVVVWAVDGPAPREHIDLVVLPYNSSSGELALLPSVEPQLVQSQSIGFENIVDRLPAGLVFANASSVHETATAELAVALALAAQRQLPRFIRAQQDARWEPAFSRGLADRRVLVLGYGGVGKAIAARLKPFEVDLVAVASRPREEDGLTVHGIDDLPTLLGWAEIVVVALPGGDSTRHVLDAAALALLPDNALVVNVGRGAVVDTDALTAEVAAGRLRAALDVVDPEPLPADHPLWGLDGAILVPHVGGSSAAMAPRVAGLVTRQIEHLLGGEEPENIVLRT